MKTRLMFAGVAAAVVAGAAFVGVVQAQDARGRGGPGAGLGGPVRAEGAGNLAGLINAFDTNKDGAVTQDEINAARGANFAKFDANHDGKLSIEEYGALWLDAQRTVMVRQFQGHDADGDGLVTVDEFNAGFANAVARADTNGDGKVDATDGRRPVAQNAPVPQPRGETRDAPRQGATPGPQQRQPQGGQGGGPRGRGAVATVPAPQAAPTRTI